MMNWGKGIILGMALFMLYILSMCIYMFRMPADEYDHQYYENGLRFDKDYDRERQVATDHAQPVIRQEGTNLHIAFAAPAFGQIKLIRPSSQALDTVFQISSDAQGQSRISLTNVQKGWWNIVLEWQSTDKRYLYQQKIDIR